MEITYKIKDNKADWVKVRTEVFLDEQGFTTEFDDIDAVATHVTIYEDDALAGCGRLYAAEHQPKTAVFGRIAVRKEFRKRGYGKYIVTLLEKTAKEEGYENVDMSAQCHAQGMYEELGYVAYGEIEMDEHVEHIHMKKKL